MDLNHIHSQIRACKSCPKMAGTPVHCQAILSPVFLLGQAPGPHEADLGKPFAHTAGKTLFRWFKEASGIDEETFRERIYMAAVAKCFPGKQGAGDRIPDANEIKNCSRHLKNELAFLKPKLILTIGKLAISEALGTDFKKEKLINVVGKTFHKKYLGHQADIICLPHPSGLSAWHKIEPGKTLLKKSLKLIVNHPAWKEAVE